MYFFRSVGPQAWGDAGGPWADARSAASATTAMAIVVDMHLRMAPTAPPHVFFPICRAPGLGGCRGALGGRAVRGKRNDSNGHRGGHALENGSHGTSQCIL